MPVTQCPLPGEAPTGAVSGVRPSGRLATGATRPVSGKGVHGLNQTSPQNISIPTADVFTYFILSSLSNN